MFTKKKTKQTLLSAVLLLCMAVGCVFLPKNFIASAETPTESALTFKKDGATTLTSQMSYVNKQIDEAVFVDIEMTLGETKERVLGFGFYEDKANSLCNGSNFVSFGASKQGIAYFKDNTNQFSDSVEALYDDGIIDGCLFGARTTFRLALSKDGDLAVSAKLTETKEAYLAKGGEEATYETLSQDFVSLVSFEGFYATDFVENGCYLGFYFASERMGAGDVTLHKIVISDSNGNVMFGDNFYYYAKDGASKNEHYSILSTTVKNAIADGTLTVTRVNPYEYLYIDLTNVSKEVYKGKEYELAPKHNYGDDATVSITVTDPLGTPTVLSGTTKYTYASVVVYQITYSVDEATKTIDVKCKYPSTQPTVETDFSAAWREDRIESVGASLENGCLQLTPSGETPASFMTKGYSEAFLCTFSVKSASDLSIVFGRTELGEYRFTFTPSGVTYTDENGRETAYELSTDYLASLSEGEVTVRLEKLGNTVKLSAKTSADAAEKLNAVLLSVDGVDCVGQVGFEVREGAATFGKFQFVNLTTLVNDNTTTVAPEATPPAQDGGETGSQTDGGCKAALGGSAVTFLAFGAAALVAFRKKEKRE